MELLSLFTATKAKNFFATAFDRANGVAQLATIKQLNTILEAVNNNTPSYVYDILLTQTGINDPTGRLIASSAYEPCENACSGGDFAKCCKTANSKQEDNIQIERIIRTGLGEYELTFIVTPKFFPNGIDQIGFFFTPFANYGDAVTISRVPDASVFTIKYIITTYDLSGSPVDDILNNTVIAMRIYPN
jgi:hypothetical protein